MYQYQKFEQDFTKQKPMLEIDFLLDSGATLNLLNEDTWNEIKYNNPEMILDKANKTLTAANNTKIDTFGTVTLNLTPDRISNNRNKPQNNFCIHFYVTQCNHYILGTPFFKCKFNINKYSEQEKEFITMFDFQHSHLTQEEFEKVVKIMLDYRQVYATTKFDVGKTKVKLNLPIKKMQYSKNKE